MWDDLVIHIWYQIHIYVHICIGCGSDMRANYWRGVAALALTHAVKWCGHSRHREDMYVCMCVLVMLLKGNHTYIHTLFYHYSRVFTKLEWSKHFHSWMWMHVWFKIVGNILLECIAKHYFSYKSGCYLNILIFSLALLSFYLNFIMLEKNLPYKK